MAKVNKGHANLRPIQKGEVRNKTGRPKSSVRQVLDTLAAEGVVLLTPSDIYRVYMALLDCTAAQLTKYANDPEVSILVRDVSKRILTGKDGGVEKVLDRAIGKAATQIVNTTNNSSEFSKMSDEELLAQINEIARQTQPTTPTPRPRAAAKPRPKTKAKPKPRTTTKTDPKQ